MIKISSAKFACNYSRSVNLENNSISFNSYWNWSLSNCCFELIGTISSNINETSDFSNSFWGDIFASSISPSVWIVRFKFKWVLFNVLESTVHKTSIATFISKWGWAVNELLFRVWVEFSCGNKFSSFNCTCGGKCPAWSTLSLVFNWSYCSLGGPVNWGWDALSIENFNIWWFFHLWSVSQHFFPFSLSVISELINSNLLGWVSWMSLNGFKSFFELSRSEFKFRFSSIRFTVFGNKSNKFIIGFSKLLCKEELSYMLILVVKSNKSKSCSGSSSN